MQGVIRLPELFAQILRLILRVIRDETESEAPSGEHERGFDQIEWASVPTLCKVVNEIPLFGG